MGTAQIYTVFSLYKETSLSTEDQSMESEVFLEWTDYRHEELPWELLISNPSDTYRYVSATGRAECQPDYAA